jgi:hypothetical protein
MRMSFLLEQLELAERDEAATPKEPMARAMVRIADAYDRGGEFEALQATVRRIDATKDQGKKEGIVAALKAIQKAEGFPKNMASLDVSQKAKSWKLSPDGIRMIEAAMRKAKRAI